MGLFRRKSVVEPAVDGATTDEPPARRAAVHAGIPGRCPRCDGFGYIDHIDMNQRSQRQHCLQCWHRWEFSFDEEGEVLDLTVFDEQGRPVPLDDGTSEADEVDASDAAGSIARRLRSDD